MDAQPERQGPSAGDSGLGALVMLLRFQGIGADLDQLRHSFAGRPVGVAEMLRCAKELGLKARSFSTNWKRLADTPFPGIAALKDGRFLVVGRVGDGKIIVQHPFSPKPELLSEAEFTALWDGRVVLMARRAALTDLTRRFDFTWFLGAIQKYKSLLVEVVVASFFLQLFALVTPLFFQVIIDKVLVHRGISTLDVLVLGMLTITIFEAVLSTLRTYLFSHTTNRIDVELGARLFRHLLGLPLAYFQARRAGDSVARVRELENIRNFLDQLGLDARHRLLLHLRLPRRDVFLLAVPDDGRVVLVPDLYRHLGRRDAALPPPPRREIPPGAENQAFLVESVSAVETLKAMAVEPQMQRRWEEQLAAYVAASFRVLSLGNTASNAVQVVSKLVTVATLYFGAKLVIDGSLSVGELVAFNIMAGRVAQPVLRIAQIWQDFHQARLSVQRLGDILNTPAEPTYTASRAALPAIRGDIAFEHVGFRYRIDGPEILHDVSVAVPAGQVLGIVGPSGSGKSTLAKLVQRMYVPESGRILVDGVDIAQIDPAWLRRQIGVVLQENVLFNRSIRENIALADPGMPIERVMAAARLAGAHDLILELPEGYDTMVGERGSTLSGGQRQRIAIARALVMNPRILIFDEATSSLDYESERIIQQHMQEIAKDRTVFVIAHRLSTVRRCDRIITIDRGRLVEDGTHDELIVTGGRYASLHRIQAGIHEVG